MAGVLTNLCERILWFESKECMEFTEKAKFREIELQLNRKSERADWLGREIRAIEKLVTSTEDG